MLDLIKKYFKNMVLRNREEWIKACEILWKDYLLTHEKVNAFILFQSRINLTLTLADEEEEVSKIKEDIENAIDKLSREDIKPEKLAPPKFFAHDCNRGKQWTTFNQAQAQGSIQDFYFFGDRKQGLTSLPERLGWGKSSHLDDPFSKISPRFYWIKPVWEVDDTPKEKPDNHKLAFKIEINSKIWANFGFTPSEPMGNKNIADLLEKLDLKHNDWLFLTIQISQKSWNPMLPELIRDFLGSFRVGELREDSPPIFLFFGIATSSPVEQPGKWWQQLFVKTNTDIFKKAFDVEDGAGRLLPELLPIDCEDIEGWFEKYEGLKGQNALDQIHATFGEKPSYDMGEVVEKLKERLKKNQSQLL